MLTWNNKQYQELHKSGSWLNLETNKFKQLPTSDKEYSIRNIYVLGSIENVNKFCKDNKIKPEIYIPYNDFITMVNCNIGLCADKKLLKVKETDIEKIDIDTLKQVEDFTLTNLYTKCRLDKVVDGDTIKVWTIISTKQLSECGKSKNSSLCVKNGEMLIKLKCRLFGINAPEISTDEGKVSKINLEKDLPEIFYIRIMGMDKYGRHLIIIYINGELYKPRGKVYYGYNI